MEWNKEGREELLEAIAIAEVMADENPCGLKDFALGAIAKGMKAIMSQQYTKSMNQEAVAKYLGVSTRTVQRYAAEYDDFPKARHDGNKDSSYDPVEVVRWKKNHISEK